jgi:hypothetical protein
VTAHKVLREINNLAIVLPLGSTVAYRVSGRGILFRTAFRRERSRTEVSPPDNDNLEIQRAPRPAAEVAVAQFRQITIWLVLASCVAAVGLALISHVRVDFRGTSWICLMIAALLLVSRVWWANRVDHRIADAIGTVATAAMGGMTCGAIAMVELRLGFPVADGTLQSWDHALGIDGIAIVEALVRQGHWIFAIMAPAYNYTLEIFFGGLIALALIGDRIEAWRGAFCFVGTLFTTCIIAAFAPAKGIAVWAPQSLLDHLPPNAMRNFWPHFDEFYFGDDPVLRLQVIDGVISFPSFHTVVGLLIFAMWRKNVFTCAAGTVFLLFMLLAIYPGGGHYFVDMLGGIVVWAAWFAWSFRIERQAHPHMALVTARS